MATCSGGFPIDRAIHCIGSFQTESVILTNTLSDALDSKMHCTNCVN